MSSNSNPFDHLPWSITIPILVVAIVLGAWAKNQMYKNAAKQAIQEVQQEQTK